MSSVSLPDTAPAVDGTEAPASQTLEGRAPTPRGPRIQTVLIWAGALAASAIVVFALLFQAHGGRWFIVETPSMGTTAPVGTLVLTTPVTADDLRVGDIITFHPPTQPGETYTHRIVAITSQGIATRGDINGANDGWFLHQQNLVGQTTTILPAVGWLVKALPILIVGFAFVMFATSLIRTPARRQSFRILGFSLLMSLTVYILKPFVGLVVLTTHATTRGIGATVVSTGILPIRATATGGTSVVLHSGEVGSVTVPPATGVSHYSMSSALHLSPLEWVLFLAICTVPLLWTVIVGLPGSSVDDDADELSDAELSAAA